MSLSESISLSLSSYSIFEDEELDLSLTQKKIEVNKVLETPEKKTQS